MSGNSSEAEEEEDELIRLRDDEDDELISEVVDAEREKFDVPTAEVIIPCQQLLASSTDHLERWKLPTVIGPDGNLIHKRKIASRINKERSLAGSLIKKSTDRNYRVRGPGRHNPNDDSSDNVVHRGFNFGKESDDNMHKNGDLFAVMVKAKQIPSSNDRPTYMVVARANRFGLKKGRQIELQWDTTKKEGFMSLNVMELKDILNSDGQAAQEVTDNVGVPLKNIDINCSLPMVPDLELRPSGTIEPMMSKVITMNNLMAAHTVLSTRGNVHSCIGIVIRPIMVESIPQFISKEGNASVHAFICNICNPPMVSQAFSNDHLIRF